MALLDRYGPKVRMGIFGVCVVVIVVSLVWIFSKLRGTNAAVEKPDIYLYCTACGKMYKPRHRLGGDFPRVCDLCGKRAAWYAVQCNDCGTVFPEVIHRPGDGQPGPPQMPVCPKCGSGNYSNYGLSKQAAKNAGRGKH
jgi:hypothetical protein